MMSRILFFLLLCLPCWAADLYCDLDVAPNVSNDGTVDHPYAWTEVDDHWAAGDTIYCRDTITSSSGTPTTIATTATPGNAGSWITFTQWAGQNQAIFDASTSNYALQIDNISQEIDHCDYNGGPGTNWVSGADTVIYSTDTRVQHAGNVKITLAAERSDGDILAHHDDIAAKNFGGRYKIAFWIRTSSSHSAGDFELVLSEGNGPSLVSSHQHVLTPALTANTWKYVCKEPDSGDTFADMNAVISVGLLANATIATGEVIYLELITFNYSKDYYYIFDGINFSATTASDTAGSIVVYMPCAGYVTINDATISGRARATPASGDFHPYYASSGAAIGNGSSDGPCRNITVSNCTIQNSRTGTAFAGAQDIAITGCTYSGLATQAVVFGNRATGTITSCSLGDLEYRKERLWYYGTWSGGTPAGGTACYIDQDDGNDKDASEPTLIYTDGAAPYKFILVTNSSNWTYGDTSHNIRDDAGTTELALTASYNAEVHEENIHEGFSGSTVTIDRCTATGDSYMLEVTGKTGGIAAPTITVQNCWVDNMQQPPIYLEGGTVNLYNNTFLGTGAGTGNSIYIYNGDSITTLNCYNNILETALIAADAVVNHDYNHFSPNDTGGGAPEIESELGGEANGTYSCDFTTGYFVNFAGGDFNLTATSPAKDAASATYAPSNDYDGVTRPKELGDDIGAYEYDPASATTFIFIM